METVQENSPSEVMAPNPRYALFAATWTMITVALLIAIKGYAYYKSGSAAVLATLTDSLTDTGISLMMLLALRYSLRPADKSHRHGHGKMEGIAALFQAAFLIGAGAFLMFESLRRFAAPEPVTNHMVGIVVAGIAIVFSVILVMVQNYCLKRAPSLAVEADQAHYSTDVLLNGSVIVALFVNYKNGPLWVDPACAFLIAGYYAWTARSIALKAMDMLMDRELPSAVRDRIKDIIGRHQEALGFHDLRTRKSGMIIHISFDVEIDPTLSLQEAHQVTRDLETMIMNDYPNAEIIIHMDPYGDTDDARHTVKGVHH